jgi:hypothetical protein
MSHNGAKAQQIMMSAEQMGSMMDVATNTNEFKNAGSSHRRFFTQKANFSQPW